MLTFKETCETSKRGLQRTWQTSPTLLKGLSVMMLVSAFIPAGLAVLAGLVVNDTKDLMNNGDPSLMAVLPWLALAAGLIALVGVSDAVKSYMSQRLGDEMNLGMSREVLEHAASLDLSFFES